MEYKDFEEISKFSKWLESLSPTEFATVATISGLILGQFLSQPEQNAIGNWLECVGQILLTMGTKPYPNQTTNQLNTINDQIEKLKKEIEHLKSNL
ncbi:MAG: hypothetical protein IKC22_05765 [Bacilli bacterium]|nr:hypothetical protein [Bacilli bacterium]